jgi:hypothetical protein
MTTTANKARYRFLTDVEVAAHIQHKLPVLVGEVVAQSQVQHAADNYDLALATVAMVAAMWQMTTVLAKSAVAAADSSDAANLRIPDVAILVVAFE